MTRIPCLHLFAVVLSAPLLFGEPPIVAAPLSPLPTSPGIEAWHTGASDDFVPAAGSTRAGLFLAGGGGDVDEAWRWFVACAGGGDLVVLRASGGDGYQDYLFEKIGGVSSVTTLKFLDASAAHDPAVLARIASAEGIFMAGGDQSRYVTFWKDTPVAAALNAHLAAGKPLGGTSAGLAVLGEHHYSAMLGSVTTDQALADPFDADVTLGSGFIAAPALTGVITDSHFMERKRLGRLVAFLARLQVEGEDTPRLVGLGIDEATALCIEPDGTARVHTAKAGSAWLVRLSEVGPLIAGTPLEARATAVGLGPLSTLDLRTLEFTSPLEVRQVHASAGKLAETVTR